MIWKLKKSAFFFWRITVQLRSVTVATVTKKMVPFPSSLCAQISSPSPPVISHAVTGGLGYGAMQLSAGIYVGIIIAMFICYNLSAISGLRNGITFLSNLNTRLFFVLLAFVLLAGPTAYICNLFTHSLGEYLNQFISASLYTAPFADSGRWAQNWDMYWWVDWMAYAPLLGLFMVRVGYGRSLREFVLVEWLFPALFGIVWFAVFGGTILHGQFF